MNNLKAQIQSALNQFANGSLADNAIALFKELGYSSSKRIDIGKNEFEALFEKHPTANSQKALIGDWKSVNYLFQLTEEEITRQKSLFSVNQYNPNEYQSYSFVAIELKNEHYARGRLSQITREVNKLFPMPAMILFKHGSSLTLSVINRRLHKRDDSKDVLEKVTLIKDIRISPAGGGVRRTGVEVPLKKGGQGVVSLSKGGEGVVSDKIDVSGGEGAVTHRAHIEILFDLSFGELKNKHGFTNFVELHDAWQKTLDTSELNKRFFKELANWYFWAMDYVEFPDDLEKKKDVRNATNLIRLITRLVFIWFIKEKELLPDLLFNKNHLNTILNDFNKNNTSNVYYHAILQNLFFGTLNQKMGERGFAREGSFSENKNEYGVKNLFRYANKFSIKENEVIELFKDIPFLNGGLFDCLDKPNDEGKVVYVDGFSRNPKKQADVPDFLFFSDEIEVDLNEIFGTRNKKYIAKGLINLLDSYKFTVAENTPIEEEIALDPELLGKVFENLLASYNPETQTTARKQTGSFYTPREIVNYMVDESLIAYLSQALYNSLCHAERSEASQDSSPAAQNDNDRRLRDLISYSENHNSFDKKETHVLIAAIDNCKILDPACGSGAFPMGILHKLVHILHKLDPRNELWKQRQIDKALQIDDPNIRDHATQDIEEAFENNELDYGRKLYLIENCIYGVDIQPIAVQIAKLRFFISLIIDEKKQPGKENLGIRSLPNLETKFVAADTLIALDKPQGQLSFRNLEIERLEKELKELRHEYFNAKTRKEKLQCQKQDKKLRQHIAGLLVNDGWNNTTARQIAAFDLYDQNASADWFDPEWMFGIVTGTSSSREQNGFDIVIANPPYGAEIDDIDSLAKNYKHFDRQKNSASFFIEVGNKLTNSKGIIAYIIPKSLSFSEGWKKTRELVTHKNRLLSVIDVCKAFEAVLLEQIIICFSKETAGSAYQFSVGEGWDGEIKVRGKGDNKLIDQLDILPMYIDNRKQGILNKLEQGTVLLSEISKTFRGLPFQRKVSKSGQPILRGKNIGKYKIYGDIDNITLPDEILSSAKVKELLNPKILSQNIVAHVMNPYDRIIIMATIDNQGLLTLDTVMNTYLTVDKFLLQYVLAILNSHLASWFYYWFVYNRAIRTMHFDKYYIDKLPVKDIDLKAQQSFITLVDQILSFKQKDPQADTSALEKQIDVMVYKLYGLTYEEVKIIEPEFTMSAVEYEAFEVK